MLETSPFELCVGGDLLTLTEAVVLKRCTGSVRITKVKGNAMMRWSDLVRVHAF